MPVSRRIPPPRLHLRPLQWIGAGVTIFLALRNMLSGGLISAIVTIALVMLITGIYGVVLRRPTWLGLQRRRLASGMVTAGALTVLLIAGGVQGANSPTPVAQNKVAVSTTIPETSTTLNDAPTSSVPTKPTPVVTTETVTEMTPVAHGSRSEDDPSADQGSSTVAPGVDGVRTRTFEVVKHDGVEVSRNQVSEAVTTVPVDEVTRVGVRVPEPKTAPACDPNYTGGCVPIGSGDVDCAGGSGNGPAYVRGPVTVVGTDIYSLDKNGDGVACD